MKHEGHCCGEGFFWNPAGYCIEAEPCYDPSNPGFCNYILSQNPTGYFNDPDCTQFNSIFEYYEACCYINLYGTYDYNWCEITPV